MAKPGDLKDVTLIPGYHPVRELLLRNPDSLLELWIGKEKRGGRVRELIELAEGAGLGVFFKSKQELSLALPGVNHQGIVALAKAFRYASLDQILTQGRQEEGQRLVVVLDRITDEGNLGSILRTAAFFGANGLIIPKRRSAKVSPKVIKLSAGAHIYLPIAQVVNLVRALDHLEAAGYWIVGTSGKGGVDIFDFDWNRDIALVLGNEQRGMGEAVKKRCHEVVAIPGAGGVESLNVGVAAGVVMSEIFRQRRKVPHTHLSKRK